MEKMGNSSQEGSKTLYAGLTLEWNKVAKSEDEARKRETIENYIRYIYNSDEFKIELEKEIGRAFADGRL